MFRDLQLTGQGSRDVQVQESRTSRGAAIHIGKPSMYKQPSRGVLGGWFLVLHIPRVTVSDRIPWLGSNTAPSNLTVADDTGVSEFRLVLKSLYPAHPSTDLWRYYVNFATTGKKCRVRSCA